MRAQPWAPELGPRHSAAPCVHPTEGQAISVSGDSFRTDTPPPALICVSCVAHLSSVEERELFTHPRSSPPAECSHLTWPWCPLSCLSLLALRELQLLPVGLDPPSWSSPAPPSSWVPHPLDLVHTEVLMLESDKASWTGRAWKRPWAQSPEAGSGRSPLPSSCLGGLALSTGCKGVNSVCVWHEIQSPVFTKHSSLGPGKVSSCVQIPEWLFVCL